MSHSQQKQRTIYKKLILFLYAAIGYPNKNTLLKAIDRGHFATWPGLTNKRVKKYITDNIINAKGHMHLQRQSNTNDKNEEEKDLLTPTQQKDNKKTNQHFAKIEETGLCGTDQTGKFPTTSKRGHKYIFVLYNFDSNSILIRPMKNRGKEEFTRVHDDLIEYLKLRGLQPTIQRLDINVHKNIKTISQNIICHFN